MIPPPLLLLSIICIQETPRPRLVLETLDGGQSELAPEALPLADPRTKGAWIVRPLGYAAPPDDPARGAFARVALVNGDELRGRVHGGTGETVELELVGGVVVPFDISSLRSLQFSGLVPAAQQGALEPANEGDRLYRRAGAALDAIDGTFEGFEAQGVRFDSVLGLRTYPWNEVAGLFVEVLERAAPPRDGERVPVAIDLAGPDGGRLRGGLVAIERAHFRIVLGGKTEVSLPFSAVAECLVADGRLIYLSDLEPSGETGRGAPFGDGGGDELGMTWPHRMDRSVLGTELRAGGAAHRRGIGMHAPSKLSFLLDGSQHTLRGRAAIDDSALVNGAAARGSVVFRVWVDGEPAWESALVRGGDPPLALPPIILTEKRELVLEVDPHGDFAGDRADWLGLALIR